MKPTIGEALDKLATLGSAQQVADFLVEQQIKALPGSPDRCAVAVYLMRECDVDDAWVWPGGVMKSAGVVTHMNLGTELMEALPIVVTTFARRFDAGEYPELQETRGTV